MSDCGAPRRSLWLGGTPDIALHPPPLIFFIMFCADKRKKVSGNFACPGAHALLCSAEPYGNYLVVSSFGRTTCFFTSRLVVTAPGACHSCERPSMDHGLQTNHGFNVTNTYPDR